MIYKQFGNTGEKVSALGFGCMRLPEIEKDGKWFMDQDKVNEMLAYAYERGINYFDTAPYYCHSHSEAAVGEAVKSFRNKVLLSSKLPGGDLHKPEDFNRFLEQTLTRMQTDHIDFYHVWGTNFKDYKAQIVDQGILPLVRKAKEEGMIRHFSFSFHSKHSEIKDIIELAEAEGVPMESMLVQYNLLDRGVEDMLKYANGEKGLGTVAMGPVGGGRLSNPTKFTDSLAGKSGFTSYELALRFVIGNPNMCIALSGMRTMDDIRKNCDLADSDRPITGEEWRQIGIAAENLKKFSDLYCTGCGYCQPCPAGIEIPKIFECFTQHNVYGLSKNARDGFEDYKKDGGKTFQSCLDCGACERKCPQHLKIREQLARVEDILNSL